MAQERPTCPSCKRPLPVERSDAPTHRRIFSVAAPKGEDPKTTLEEPLAILHAHFEELGATSLPPIKPMSGWKYYTLALALGVLLQNIHGLTLEESGG